MGLMHKPTLYDDPATKWLMGQSKAALADMLTEVLRCEQESADDPATEGAAVAKWSGLLERRKALKGLAKKFSNRQPEALNVQFNRTPLLPDMPSGDGGEEQRPSEQ